MEGYATISSTVPVELLPKISEFFASLNERLDIAPVRRKAKPWNPSPSGDPWFDDPRNLAIVDEGLAQAKAGMLKEYTLDEIDELLGLK